jgi:hypothetical protein
MAQKHVVFKCLKCQTVITRPLLPLGYDESVCLEDQKTAVRVGFFGINRHEYWNVNGRFLVNLADLVGTKHHSERRRLFGCCGPDGTNGPNLICPNGHEVGTEKSDCWMSHAAILLDDVDFNEC